MIKVFIPRYRTVGEPNRKSFTVFEIDIYVSGKLHRIESRYREFHDLHKRIKKIVLVTPDFPPKRIKNWNQRVLEQRRKGLESYCQELLRQNPVPSPLLIFLEIPIHTIPTLNSDWKDDEISHQRLMSFKSDLFTRSLSSDDLPDIVVKEKMTEP